jgi:hypothetical protein
MPLYCTMVNACGQIGGYPIRSYMAPAVYVEHAEVPSALKRNTPPIVPVLFLAGWLQCAPRAGQFHAAVLTVCRA